MKDKIYKFNETKNQYKILGEALMKNPGTREWQDCVIYQQYKNWEDGKYYDVPGEKKMTFVREKKEFLTKFTKVL